MERGPSKSHTIRDKDFPQIIQDIQLYTNIDILYILLSLFLNCVLFITRMLAIWFICRFMEYLSCKWIGCLLSIFGGGGGISVNRNFDVCIVSR